MMFPGRPALAGGKLLVPLQIKNGGGRWRATVLRLDENGFPDDTFGIDGYASLHAATTATPSFATRVLPLPSGGMLVAWQTGGSLIVTRLDGFGAFDPTFGVGGSTSVTLPAGTTPDIVHLARMADGKILLATNARSPDGKKSIAFYRFSADGVSDEFFGEDGLAWLRHPDGAALDLQDLVALPDGRILVSGALTPVGQSVRGFAARLTSDAKALTRWAYGELAAGAL